jgi:hypothetical protein
VQRGPEEPADLDGLKKWILQIAWIVFKTDFLSPFLCLYISTWELKFFHSIVDTNSCESTVNSYRG